MLKISHYFSKKVEGNENKISISNRIKGKKGENKAH